MDNRALTTPETPRPGLPRTPSDVDAVLRERWLKTWVPANPVIPASENEILGTIAKLRAALVPADQRLVAIALDRTMALWHTPDQWERTAEFYLEALADIPADLIEATLRELRMRHAWNNAPKRSSLSCCAAVASSPAGNGIEATSGKFSF